MTRMTLVTRPRPLKDVHRVGDVRMCAYRLPGGPRCMREPARANATFCKEHAREWRTWQNWHRQRERRAGRPPLEYGAPEPKWDPHVVTVSARWISRMDAIELRELCESQIEAITDRKDLQDLELGRELIACRQLLQRLVTLLPDEQYLAGWAPKHELDD